MTRFIKEIKKAHAQNYGGSVECNLFIHSNVLYIGTKNESLHPLFTADFPMIYKLFKSIRKNQYGRRNIRFTIKNNRVLSVSIDAYQTIYNTRQELISLSAMVALL